MTPPSLTVAREILIDAAAKARTSGDPVAELAAAAIDVVLAELDARPSVHGAASVITVSTPAAAATAPTAILIGSIPGVRQIRSRDDAREAFGRRDGDAVWDAFGRAPPVFVAPVHEASVDFKAEPAHRLGPEAVAVSNEQRSTTTACAEHACTRHPSCLAATARCGCPECQRATASATSHGTAIPPDAMVADMLPCPFCGRADVLHVETFPGTDWPVVRCAACLSIGPSPGPEGRTARGATAHWNRRSASAADLRLVPVFESREGRDRGDISDVVASCEASRLVTIKEFALIDEPPGISVGFVVDAQQVKALRGRVDQQRAIAQEPPLGTRTRVIAGEHAGFVGTVQPRGADDPPGWSRVRRDLGARETRLFESKHLAPAEGTV